MPETREELEQQLHGFQEEKKRNEAAILETRKLLEKVDKKRRENPRERQKWDAKLDSLEELLSEKKRLLTSSQTHIIQIQRKLDSEQFSVSSTDTEASAPASPVSEPAPTTESLPQDLTMDDLKRAVQRVMGTHLVRLQSVSDLDYRMAKAFMASNHASRLSRDQAEEMRKRLRMLDRTRGPAQKSATPAKKESAADTIPEREAASTPETQTHLKSALQKCEAKTLDAMTLAELEVLAKYAKALAQKTPDANELPALQAALDLVRKQLQDSGLI